MKGFRNLPKSSWTLYESPEEAVEALNDAIVHSSKEFQRYEIRKISEGKWEAIAVDEFRFVFSAEESAR